MKKKDNGLSHPFRRGPGTVPTPSFSEEDLPKLHSENELKYLSTLQQIVKWTLETSHKTAAAEVAAIITKNSPEL